MSKLNIVVVGGGGVAVKLLGQLGTKIDRTKYRIVLINPRPFYMHLLVGARATATSDGGWGEKAMIPFDKILSKEDELIVGSAASIHRTEGSTGGQVVLEDGKEVAFAILVLATGSTWPEGLNYPNTKEEISALLADRNKRVAAAKSIVIAGGGAVGLELAGELRHFSPNVKVTLVQKAPQLLNDAYPNRFRAFAEKRIRAIGVNLILDDSVIDSKPENGVVKTAKGQQLAADLLIQAVGAKPNTEFLRSLPDALSSTGHVKIQQTLQLTSYPEIFAGGDIIETTEQRTLSKCEPQAAVIAANIVALTKGAQAAKKYTGFPEFLILPFGPSNGVSYMGILWGLIWGGWVTNLLKKDLFLGNYAGSLNYKV
ncbi:FAD/NAD(P)-binding domain-containing protein [Auriculariales sp. MPI-PUGE-AT-0066]|nr:FAD/NAD(P)-binding domain-containing protein [Auriculariales sp. MPI-PUGE-AT-0066]